MKFVADENIDEPIISALRNFQLNILSVGEIMCGCSDTEILEFANSNNSFLLLQIKILASWYSGREKLSGE